MTYNECNVCKSEDIEWFLHIRDEGNAVDGRLKLSEMHPIAVLGCNTCSNTITVLDAEDAAKLLNDR